MTKNARLRNIFLALALAIVTGAILSGRSVLISPAHAESSLTSIIVELRSDPVVVAKARADAAGGSFDAEAHRQQVIAEQQSFLQRLTLAGVPYVISSVTAPNAPVTPTIQFRFNFVYNGIALQVPAATIPTIAGLPEVLGVHPDEPIVLHLNRAVDYTRAPGVYGNPPRLTQFDTLNTGGIEGDGANIAVIDTGSTGPMKCSAATRHRPSSERRRLSPPRDQTTK